MPASCIEFDPLLGAFGSRSANRTVRRGRKTRSADPGFAKPVAEFVNPVAHVAKPVAHFAKPVAQFTKPVARFTMPGSKQRSPPRNLLLGRRPC